MESVIRKISEIESAASAIVANAEKQKESLDHEYRARRNAFDEELEDKTMREIQKIRDDLESKTSALLNEQSVENDDSITELQRQYNEYHTRYSQDILKRITEV
ncbi:hypothetical protein [Mediterraneibacter agrestimuris]|uniref:hypothetical protein n=1 Tax=Mediterraneibacter agrestimuris TaxID=2941333 RepID=UPI00203C7EFC|nr:hypothetical protein [Mediterraneibacter agrestimuris]